MTIWLTIVASVMAGYVMRMLPLALDGRADGHGLGRRYLDLLPVGVIAALAGAGVAFPEGQPTGGAEVGAAFLVVAVAAWRRDLLAAVICGVIAVAVLRAHGL